MKKKASVKHLTMSQAPITFQAPITSQASNTRMAIKNTPSNIYKDAVRENEIAWRTSLDREIRKFINAFGGPTTADMVKIIFDDVNGHCKNCHPGGFDADGCACSGTTTVKYTPCSMAALEDTPAFPGMLLFKILGGVRVNLADKCFIPEGTTIVRYGGGLFSNEHFLNLPLQQQAFGIQEQDSTSWIVPSGQKVGPKWTADIKYPGARIAFSKTSVSNCVVQQTTNGSLVVVATRAIKGGDQLLYPRVGV